ncbi:MAG TPA: hypothetical protein VGG43_10480, partial [Acidimicrobiales bacterium]
AIGIPPSFRSQVIAAVTTGSLGSQARGSAGKGNASIQQIINEVVGAAYGAFGHGLDLALTASGALLLASAVVAFFTASWVRGRSSRRGGGSPVATAEPG